MQVKQLLRQRIQTTWGQASRIIALIAGGGGTPIVVGILLIGLYMAYQIMLTNLPTDFPFDWIMWAILTYVISTGEYRPWLEKADLIFLLPLENKMSTWRRSAFLYSISMAMVRLIVILFLLYPIYRVRIGTAMEWRIAVGILLLLQFWALWVRVMEDHRQFQTISSTMDRICRWSIITFLVYWAIHPLQIYTILAILIPIAHSFWLIKTTSTSQIPWVIWYQREHLIRNRWRSFASWFVELRGIERPVKQRKWLIQLITRWIARNEPFQYLYWRTFIRRSDLFASFYRLWIWAGILMVSLPYNWIPWIVIPLVIWLFATQMPGLITRQAYPLWVKLYPISSQQAINSWAHMTRALVLLLGIFLTMIPVVINRITLIHSIGLLFASWIIGFIVIRSNQRKLIDSNQINR